MALELYTLEGFQILIVGFSTGEAQSRASWHATVMPELPDILLYIDRLKPRILGQPIERIRIASPFLVRSFDPPITKASGKRVLDITRLGKRIVFGLEEELFLIFHLMIAGRFRWRKRNVKIAGKLGLAAFDFPSGTLLLTEASSKKRASLHLVRSEQGLREHHPGGLEVLEASLEAFASALTRESHTLKRALTDQRLLNGIGNAYSDEILHRARLSPVVLTQKLTEEEILRLYQACRESLTTWIKKLRDEDPEGFPEKVTAFREGMAVHGRYRQPCPVCGSPVQRIVYAENEANYCARCQTHGKLLADRALSRLLKGDWPRTLEDLEQRKASRALR